MTQLVHNGVSSWAKLESQLPSTSGLNSFTSRLPHFPALTEEFRDQLLGSGPAPPLLSGSRPTPPGPGQVPEPARKTTLPRVHRERAGSATGVRSPAPFLSRGTAVRSAIMALFPAFAGVSEAPDSGNPRRGKQTKGTGKALSGLKTQFLGPRSWPCFGFVYPCVSQSSPRRCKAFWEGPLFSSWLLGWSCRVLVERKVLIWRGKVLDLELTYYNIVGPHSFMSLSHL